MARSTAGVRTWLFLLSLLTSVPLVLFAGFVTYRLTESERAATLTNLVQRTDAAANAVQQHIQGWSTVLMALGQTDEALGGNLQGMYEHAVRMRTLAPDAASITLLDRTGAQLFNTLRPFGADLPPSAQPDMAARVLETGETQLSDVFRGAVTDLMTISVGMPVLREGVPAYSLHMNVPVKVLNAVLDAQNLPEGWYAAVVNRQGTVLSRNRAPETVVGRKATAAFREILARSQRGVVDLPSEDGTPLKRAFVKMPPWDVTVMIGVPETIYWAPFRQSMALVGAGGVALVTLGLLLAAWFSGRLARDVAGVSAAAAALGRGEAPRPAVTGIRQIDDLGRALLDAHALLRSHDAARDAEHRAAVDARLQAEEASLSKSKFLAAASHDLRQPLQSLMLFASVLRTHIQGARALHAMTHLERGLDALKELLDSLLDVSRLDAGTIEPALEDFSAGTLVDTVGAAYKGIAEAKGLALEVRLCDAVVRSDRTLLARMLRNLVENAVRYTEAGTVRIACQAEGGRLRILVTDTGIGIPSEHLSRIWEEFHQVANSERDRNQGLGLGLAIVRRLSRLLDHPVEVRSEAGKGSEFSIAVPLGSIAAEPVGTEDPYTVPRPGPHRFAVVVDDDTMVLLGLTAILESWGYTVVTATSAEAAVERLAGSGERPDIILSDYRLPHGSGTQTILRIRDLCGVAIPGILLTGETGPEVAREAAANGLHLVHKPVTPRQLAEVLSGESGTRD
ncbi:ATP-binding protein [Azospirillum sp. SYSU D00513]|uniref:ATP-binding protein n=1 Tax=Azospirillum sp. SYSU D00513 TaxID=2812561 RepID=UPI001FFEF303|nr:ATP-binding protein [Azospirillum sp. SYSU D00513]